MNEDIAEEFFPIDYFVTIRVIDVKDDDPSKGTVAIEYTQGLPLSWVTSILRATLEGLEPTPPMDFPG